MTRDPANRGDAQSVGHHAQARAAVTPIRIAARSVSGTVAQIPPIVTVTAIAPTQLVRSRWIPYAANMTARTAIAICHSGEDAPRGPDPTNPPRKKPVAAKAVTTAAPHTSPQSGSRLRSP